MSESRTQDHIYRLHGDGIELTYRRGDGKLDISGDEPLLSADDVDVQVTVEPETGLHVTATLLESSRNGTRVMLTLLLPELRETPGRVRTLDVTGVAIVTSSFQEVLGGPPPVLQSHEDVRRLEGTAMPAD
jgi:hypothetical protein